MFSARPPFLELKILRVPFCIRPLTSVSERSLIIAEVYLKILKKIFLCDN